MNRFSPRAAPKAMRFELGDDLEAVTQLAVRKSDLERVLDQLKRRPLEL